MSIKDFQQKIKLSINGTKDRFYSQDKGLKISADIYIVLIIVLVGTASFGLGKISSYEKTKTPIQVLKTKESLLSTVLESTPNNNGEVVASKSGTKYYYPWCTGVSRIKEENKVWYNSIDEARKAGLSPASNCTGLK